MGSTTLLTTAFRGAARRGPSVPGVDVRVVEIAGAEAEAHLPWAALHRLCAAAGLTPDNHPPIHVDTRHPPHQRAHHPADHDVAEVAPGCCARWPMPVPCSASSTTPSGSTPLPSTHSRSWRAVAARKPSASSARCRRSTRPCAASPTSTSNPCRR
ncbi:hypothetical protein BJF85_12775 [Saccharomonospora sp. CUA-673]|uniref:hypothetical protein n=1 Tax=Saccharomonospora sp. CUA-673 TaxID=1904969 RepID=UPI0009654A16|nr:hypothetical protein [Saccharomonospora sp. CUA-673]OLT48390.1 hypothetical protein BJF85_12775 [Saccharomonospora sp. CUA-673]